MQHTWKKTLLTLLGVATLGTAIQAQEPVTVRDIAPPVEEVAAKLKEYVDVATNRPLYEPGVIIVKLRAGVEQPTALGFFNEGANPSFPLSSLQEKFISTRASGLEQMFPASQVREDVRLRRIENGADKSRKELEQIYRVYIPADADVVRTSKLFESDPNVEYAEPEPIMYTLAVDPYCAEDEVDMLNNDNIPNDPEIGRLHYLNQIGAPLAWNIHKGENGPEIVVGIVDSGVRWYHPDLVDNIYQNLGEDANNNGYVIEFVNGQWQFDPGDLNGRDDDGDGYIDNLIGLNFAPERNNFARHDPDDRSGHGTHVAGSAAARTDNGIGVPAISWNVKFISTAHGSTERTLTRTLEGVVLCADMGADVINCSFGGNSSSRTAEAAYRAILQQGTIIVAGAGNDNNEERFYPANYPGVISVASVNRNDRKANYSNFNTDIIISAPGGEGTGANGIFSTHVTAPYRSISGTSMASPVAASCFALLRSYRPNWTADQIIEQILLTADDIDAQNPNFAGKLGKRINIGRAMTEIGADIFDFVILDENNDGVYDPNETLVLKSITMDLSGTGGGQLDFRLRSQDPTITILDSVFSGTFSASNNITIDPDFRLQLSDENGLVRIITLEIVILSGEDEIISGKIDLMTGKGGVVIHERSKASISSDFLFNVLSENNRDLHFVRSYNRLLNIKGADAVFMTNSVRSPSVFVEADATLFENYLAEGGKLYADGLYDLPNMEEALQQRFFDIFGLRGVRAGIDPLEHSRPISGSLGSFLGTGFELGGGAQAPIPADFFYSLQQALGERILLRQQVVGPIGMQREFENSEAKNILISPYSIADFQDSPASRAEMALEALRFFGIEPVSVKEEQRHNSLSARIFPNPAHNAPSVFAFFDEQGGEYQIRLFDYTGKQVFESEMQLSNGQQNISFPLPSERLSAGTYYARLYRAGISLATLPLVVLK